MKHIFLITVLLLAGSLPANADCPEGFVPDCNGYCVPESYLFDDICDDGLTQEYPIGSEYYVDFSCEEMFCDLFNCTGCEGGCGSGFVLDCSGNCVPASYVRDGICDTGQRLYNGLPIVLSCEQFVCDLGDCSGVCNFSDNSDNLNDVGACCIGGTCAELRLEDCWLTEGYFMGNYTLCQSNTCGCGEGWTQDCSNNCIPVDRASGGFCAHGEHHDYGDGVIVIDLDCEALACGSGSCLGVCPGGCCTGAECIEMNNYQECLDIGGIFLGSYVTCQEAGIEACVDQQQPIQLPNTELEWSGALGSVILFPQWLVSEEDILVAGAIHNEVGEWQTAICIFRYVDDQWVEEALLFAPTGHSMDSQASYATDGNRIIVSSYINVTETTGRRAFDIFIYNEKTNTWDFEQTIDDGPTTANNDGQFWGDAVAIDGDALVIGNPALVIDGTDEGGGADLYHFANGVWALTETLSRFGSGPDTQDEDFYLGMSVAIEGDIIALSSTASLWIYDISESVAVGQQHIVDIVGNSHPRHRAIDIDNGRILGNMVHPRPFGSGLEGPIFEYIDSTWTKVATLRPFDVTASDGAGYISELNGDMAIVTSVNDNDLGHQTGSAYVWKYNGAEWVFEAKLWSNRAVSGNQFGTSAALHGGSAYLSERIDQDEGGKIKVFWPRGIAWSNPIGGLISDAINWDPIMPITSDSVSFSLRSQTPILVDQDFPFSEMFIGPGSYSFDLQGTDRTFGAGQEAINLQGVPGIIAELKLRGGILYVDGEVHNGEGDLPGKIALVSNETGEMGGIHVDGLYMQREVGELLIEINTAMIGIERPAPVQISSSIPLLDGVLELILDDGYVPQDGDIIPLLSSELIDQNSAQFSIVLINDSLPEGLYIKIIYIDDGRDAGGTIYAEVDLLTNLFGYGEPSSENVTGIASDVVAADFGSNTRTADGFDDLAVTTMDAVHLFLNDGNGGIASQVTMTSALFTSLSAIDAGDIDGDGKIDLVVTDAETDMFIPIYNVGNEIASFAVGDPESTGPNPTDVLLLNMDTDSDDDVVVCCNGYTLDDGQLDFYASSPAMTGSFIPIATLPSPGNPKKIKPGDVNHDKDLLQLFVSFDSGNAVGEVVGSVMLQGIGWNYASFTQVAIGPRELSVGDLNGDSMLDVVVSCTDSDAVSVLRGLADGSLAEPLQLLVGLEPADIELIDYDNDGDLDIAVIATTLDSGVRAVSMYRNDTSNNGGNLMFARDTFYDAGANPVLIAKGDLDGDAHDDLVSITQATSFRGGEVNQVRLRNSGTQVICEADFDGSGEVNVLDLLEIIAAWEATGAIPQDLNDDGIVNVSDLLILIAAWGACT